MKKEPAVTLHNNYINLRQEHRDKISAQTEDFINNGGKVDEKLEPVKAVEMTEEQKQIDIENYLGSTVTDQEFYERYGKS